MSNLYIALIKNIQRRRDRRNWRKAHPCVSCENLKCISNYSPCYACEDHNRWTPSTKHGGDDE